MRHLRTSLALLFLCGFASLIQAVPHAERHVAAAVRRGSQMTSSSSMDDSDTIALLETDIESQTHTAAAALTEQCAENNASLSGPRTLSCCSGFLCPFQNAVCCGGTSHCCPSGTVCAVACATCPPICRPPGMANDTTVTPPAVVSTPEPPAPEPVKHRVVKLEVLPSDSMAKTMRASEQDEKAKERDAQRRQEEEVKKKREAFHKKLLEAAQKKREARAATENAEAAKRQKEINKIRAIMNLAVNHPDLDNAPNITVNFSSSITSDVAQVRDKDVIELNQQDDEAAMTGHPWPPMAALLNDGLGGIWVKINNIDWLGFGLIRNGSINRVSNIEDCRLQCEALQECRVFKYVRNTQECWLDSSVAKRASACALVDGKRECESWVKKNQRWDANYEYGVTSVKDKDWKIVNQQNWNGEGDIKAGGRLIRNGRRNIVNNLSECITQCAEEKYCRALVYMRPNGECWLSSAVAEKGTRCARRLGRRDCISYIKRKTNPERPEEPAAEIKVSGNKEHQAITIENSGNAKQATTLSINLPQN